MMKTFFIPVIIALTTITILSCTDSSTNSPYWPVQTSDTLIVQNIPWTLTSATLGDSVIDLTICSPFQFLINDSLVFGDDGCNSYHGEAARTPDSLIVKWISFTLLGCSPLHFVSCNLINEWGFSANDSMIVLRAIDAELVFHSRFTRSVHTYPFVNKGWKLNSSNDPCFDALSAADLLPTMTLSADRGFTLRWYCSPENPVGCNSMMGVFGVGADQALCLYRKGGGGTYRFYDIGDIQMEWRMVGATGFEFTSNTLTLARESDGIYYEFVQVE